MQLPADLITLSGCSTGLNVVAKGDELLGLVRGLLHSGARTLLLTLWDVQDRTAAEAMKSFYLNLQAGSGKAEGLRRAMIELRDRHPHPYHWAPFFLTGSAE
jgi:CHAT domain-containing protein